MLVGVRTRTIERPAQAGKLSPPRLGRVFDRERLFLHLDEQRDAPALWLGAAPGAGKSTLIATWLQRGGAHTLWFQVDPSDADPATFAQSLDDLLIRSAAAPAVLPSFRADDLSDLAGWLRRRLHALLPHLPDAWVLVFDNYQELSPDSPWHAAIAPTLAALPSGVQWIFVSREPPAAPFAGALARQQLVQLDAEALRFSAEETLALTRLHGRPDAMARALEVAGGWAGGITLMLLGSPRDAIAPAVQARERLFDYFAGEVLARMLPAQRSALGAIAFLPSATDELAIAVSGQAAAPQLLEQLAAVSLFTDRREGPPRSFVFHALFGEFLRRRYASEYGSSALAEVQRRAGTLLIEHGQVDAGLQHLLQAQAWPAAAAAVLQAAPRFFTDGRTSALLTLIDALPAEWQRMTAYWRGLCVLDHAPDDARAALALAYDDAARAGRPLDELLAVSASAVAWVATGRLAEIDAWTAVLDRHIEVAAGKADDDVEMRLVPGLLAALVYRAPWHALADNLAERAERLIHRDDAAAQGLLIGSLAFHLLWGGHVDRLDRVIARIDALCAQGMAAPVTLLRWWGVGILVKALIGELRSARTDADRALALVDAEPSVAAQRTQVELLSMLVALAGADAATARRDLGAASKSMRPDNAVDRTTLEHQRGMLALLEGDTATALRLMRASVASAAQGAFPMRQHIALIANALAAAHGGEHDEARRLLDAVQAHPFHAVCRWHHWVAGVVAAYAALRRGDEMQALQQLRAALSVARAYGFRHGPMLYCCGDMMARLSALALAHGIEPDVVRDIVWRNDLAAPDEADASWPWAVRIRALGRLAIERADGPLPASRKESRRLLELAALLTAQGSAPIGLDAVADALWPDADGDAARHSLDNAVHRLRKLLGGDDCLLQRQGALAFNPRRCWSDMRELESLLDRLDGASLQTAPALIARLRGLYRAPLLADESLPRVVERRRTLHAGVQRSLLRAGDRLAAAGLAQAAEAAREPLFDA